MISTSGDARATSGRLNPVYICRVLRKPMAIVSLPTTAYYLCVAPLMLASPDHGLCLAIAWIGTGSNPTNDSHTSAAIIYGRGGAAVVESSIGGGSGDDLSRDWGVVCRRVVASSHRTYDSSSDGLSRLST